MHLHKFCRNIVCSMLESFQETPNDRQVAFVIDFYRFMTVISINKPLDMIIVANTYLYVLRLDKEHGKIYKLCTHGY